MKRQIIGITGGIGAGKSMAARILGELGAYPLDADAISRNALDMGTPCYRAVTAWLGHSVLHTDGTVNRQVLAERVFSDEESRQRLNAILHPYVLQTLEKCTKEIISRDPNACVVWDVPLLFESGFDKRVGYTVLITAPVELRLQRLAMPLEKALRRMRSQWTDEVKTRLADNILPNEGSPLQLRQAMQVLYQDWRKRYIEQT